VADREYTLQMELALLRTVAAVLRAEAGAVSADSLQERVDQVHVQGLEKCARATASKAPQQVMAQAATDWVRYVAQSTLKGKRPTGQASTTRGHVSEDVTDLEGYYGKYYEGGRRTQPGWYGGNEGAAGLLRVDVQNHDDGIAGEMTPLRIVSVDINKLNAEMAELILSGDHIRTLDDVKVPKEVNVKFKIPHGRGKPLKPILKMAIDERGHVGAQRNVDDEGVSPPSGIEIWDQIRRLPIPKDEAK
jgi:hypothetical protein